MKCNLIQKRLYYSRFLILDSSLKYVIVYKMFVENQNLDNSWYDRLTKNELLERCHRCLTIRTMTRTSNTAAITEGMIITRSSVVSELVEVDCVVVVAPQGVSCSVLSPQMYILLTSDIDSLVS